MKILIWCVSFFVIVGIPNALIMELNGRFGAIPTMILAGAAYWVAKTLCKKWDEHKKKTGTQNGKETAIETSDSETNVPGHSDPEVLKHPSENISETISESISSTEKTQKSPKKFRFNKITATIVTLSVLLCASIGINLYQTYSNAVLQDNITVLEEDLKSAKSNWEYYENRYSTFAKRINELNDEVDELEDSLYFYEKYAVIIPNDGTNTYHTYDCEYCSDSSFLIFNVANAKNEGYSPCRHCRSVYEFLYNQQND